MTEQRRSSSCLTAAVSKGAMLMSFASSPLTSLTERSVKKRRWHLKRAMAFKRGAVDGILVGAVHENVVAV
eukprot:13292557-Alexandrium_andersonii.AAC.1